MIYVTNNNDEWETPQDLFEEYNKIYNFKLDACASAENKKCNIYFNKENNALLKEWCYSSVWCNPPYSRGNIDKFVKKCFEEWKKYNNNIVLLIPAKTDTLYFHNYILPYCKIIFIKGRLRFNNTKNCAPFPSIICIYEKKERKKENDK